jgi:hypothetical protein
MAIVKIHITKKEIMKCLTNGNGAREDNVDAIYNRVKSKTLGFYALQTKEICLYLDKIADASILFDGVVAKEKTLEERVCYVITHEEIHNWLLENEGEHASRSFDNIAFRYMKEM